ncbi:hypothetical protein PENSPDRAFT_280909 [Peniophora sp. CONT]|nr:hypothetical protein PENSPDRAFT_280909 [Peniophora sp. CONT]
MPPNNNTSSPMFTMLPDRTSHDWTPVADLPESSRSEIDVEEYLLGTDSDEPYESQEQEIAHASADPEGSLMALPHAPVNTIRSTVASTSLLSEAPSLSPPITQFKQERFCDAPVTSVIKAAADGSGGAMDVGKPDRFCHQCRHKRARTEVMVCTSGRSPKHRRGFCRLAYCRNCINSRCATFHGPSYDC